MNQNTSIRHCRRELRKNTSICGLCNGNCFEFKYQTATEIAEQNTSNLVSATETALQKYIQDSLLLSPLPFPLTITMVKSNIQNKSSATNARPPGPQATPTSVGEFPDSLNLISCASSRAGKCIHPRGRIREHLHFHP